MKLFRRKLKEYIIEDGGRTTTVRAHRMEPHLRQGVTCFVFYKSWKMSRLFATTDYPISVSMTKLNIK